MTESGLAWPPEDAADLSDFPRHPAAPELHRLSEHIQPWWYCSSQVSEDPSPPGGGRFDLAPPLGTCYLAEDLEAALGEKLLRRPKRLIPSLRLRELFHAEIQVHDAPQLADLTHPRASAWGINAEIHTTLDLAKPRAWAQRFHEVGSPGLRYAARSDPAMRSRSIALFGGAGLHHRAPVGMRTEVRPLDRQRARALLEARGVHVVPIPHDVATVKPPSTTD